MRDEDSGELWTPTALPIRDEPAPYIARHGQGYSRFEHAAHGIALELLQYVPLADPIKISRLTLRNISGPPAAAVGHRLCRVGARHCRAARRRRSSSPSIDAATGAMLARNPWNVASGARVAFADLGGRQTAWTADRARVPRPQRHARQSRRAERRASPLSQRVGAGLDPCARAADDRSSSRRGGTIEVVFFLGQAGDAAEARALIERYRAADLDAVLAEVTDYWDELLGRGAGEDAGPRAWTSC